MKALVDTNAHSALMANRGKMADAVRRADAVDGLLWTRFMDP